MADELARQENNDVARPEESEFTFRPRADIWEDAEAYYLDLEMPGVDENSVDVSVEKGTLRVLGRGREEQPEGYSRSYTEFHAGNFERSFQLSDGVDSEQIDASMRHGVLTLTLPKPAAAKPRRIEIRAG